MSQVSLTQLGLSGMSWAQVTVEARHYLHARVPSVCRPEGWAVHVAPVGRVGCLIVCRPQATRCYPWYGSVADVATGRAEVTRWQVLNLARVWLSHDVQPGGQWHDPAVLPGYVDRRGRFCSTLASTVLRLLIERAGLEYLLAQPPVYPDEPYEVRWLLSYCDTRRHRGVIYQAAGWELYRTAGPMQTWRVPLPPLTPEQHARVLEASRLSERGRRYRGRRAAVGSQPCLLEVSS